MPGFSLLTLCFFPFRGSRGRSPLVVFLRLATFRATGCDHRRQAALIRPTSRTAISGSAVARNRGEGAAPTDHSQNRGEGAAPTDHAPDLGGSAASQGNCLRCAVAPLRAICEIVLILPVTEHAILLIDIESHSYDT